MKACGNSVTAGQGRGDMSFQMQLWLISNSSLNILRETEVCYCSSTYCSSTYHCRYKALWRLITPERSGGISNSRENFGQLPFQLYGLLLGGPRVC